MLRKISDRENRTLKIQMKRTLLQNKIIKTNTCYKNKSSNNYFRRTIGQKVSDSFYYALYLIENDQSIISGGPFPNPFISSHDRIQKTFTRPCL